MVIFYSYVKLPEGTVWKTWWPGWKVTSKWENRGKIYIYMGNSNHIGRFVECSKFFCCWSTDPWSNVVENVFRTHRNMHCWNPKPKAAKGYSMKLPSPVDGTKRLQQHLDLRPASPASGFHQQNMAQQSTKKPGWNRSDSQPLPGFSAQKPLEPPAASNITGVTQVSTMIRMAKKQSKLNLGRNRLLHVALSHPRYKNGTWGRKVNLPIYALVALMYLQ